MIDAATTGCSRPRHFSETVARAFMMQPAEFPFGVSCFACWRIFPLASISATRKCVPPRSTANTRLSLDGFFGMFKTERLHRHLTSREVSRNQHSCRNRNQQQYRRRGPFFEDQLTDPKQRTVDQRTSEYPIDELQRQVSLCV